jgi:hypothetical protein
MGQKRLKYAKITGFSGFSARAQRVFARQGLAVRARSAPLDQQLAIYLQVVHNTMVSGIETKELVI